MSVKVLTWVFESSEARSNHRCVLLALADEANDYGVRCYPGFPVLAKKGRCGESTARKIVDELEGAGEIIVWRGRGKGHPNHYAVVMGRPVAEVVALLEEEMVEFYRGRKPPKDSGIKTARIERFSDETNSSTDSGKPPDNRSITADKPLDGVAPTHTLTLTQELDSFQDDSDAKVRTTSSKRPSTRKDEDPQRAETVQSLVAFFVDTARGAGKPALTTDAEIKHVGRLVKAQVAAGSTPAQIAEGIRRAVKTNRPGNLASLVAGVQDQDGRAILPYDHPVSESARKLAAGRSAERDPAVRDPFGEDEGEPSSLAEVFGGLGILPAGGTE